MFWRRRLPHWVPEKSIVFVTWHLAGTMPFVPELIRGAQTPGHTFALQHRQLDSTASGHKWLKNPQVAALVTEVLLYGATTRHDYDLHAWVVMPNHVHLVFEPHRTLSQIVNWLKTSTARRANQLLSRTGQEFWQREYYDRWIRTDRELDSVIAYVESNPVKAGLVKSPEDWPWSSAATGL